MSTILTIPDAAELLAHTMHHAKMLGAAGVAAMLPIGGYQPKPTSGEISPPPKTASNEVEKTEVTRTEGVNAPEYIAPGQQYANVDEAHAHLISLLHNPQRNQHNDELDFTYATLAVMLDQLRQPLYEHGLSVKQEMEKADPSIDPMPFNMVTTFKHIPTSTTISFKFPAYEKEDKRLDDCQRIGATFTYFRRYGLKQSLGITDGDDDADQSARKKRERKGRRLSEMRVCRPAPFDRNKDESILNVLVAVGHTEHPELVENAKLRNPHLFTPQEVAEFVLSDDNDDCTDEDVARDIVLRFGLFDNFWRGMLPGYECDGDEIYDKKTGRLITAKQAREIANTFVAYSISAAQRYVEVRKMEYKNPQTHKPYSAGEMAYIVATGNESVKERRQLLKDLRDRCEPHTQAYIDTLMSCLEPGSPVAQLPAFVPEHELL